MNRKIAVGVLSAVLLMSGALVGVGYARGNRSSQATVPEEPTVIELEWHTGGKGSHIRFYPLREDAPGGRYGGDGPSSGQATTKKLPLFDVDGNQVGREYIDCMATVDTGWVCTLVSMLQDGPYTDKGSVVATGVSKHRIGMPNISTLPVTGGTGAYSNVSGQAIQEGVDGKIKYTLYLWLG